MSEDNKNHEIEPSKNEDSEKETEKPNEGEISFSFLGRKKIEVEVKDINISSDSGLIIFKEVDEKYGFTKKFVELLEDRRWVELIDFTYKELLCQRVYSIIGGYVDQNDAKKLKSDPIIKMTAGRGVKDANLSSQPTISRFENHITKPELKKLREYNLNEYLNSFKSPPEKITLHIDSTNNTCYGEQQYALFNGYYGETCYHPLKVFDGITGQLVFMYLRPGNVASARWSVPIISWLTKKIRKKFPKVKIEIVGDSAFATPRLYKFCEANNITYIINMIANPNLGDQVEDIVNNCETEYKDKKETIVKFGEFGYCAGSWDKFRRIIYKIEVNSHSTDVRYIVVRTDQKGSPEKIYKEGMKRGATENRIKELKSPEELNSSRMSLSDFKANRFRTYIYGLAYAIIWNTRKYFKGTELENAQPSTLRIKLIKIGCVVKETYRRIIITFSKATPYLKYWHQFFSNWNKIFPALCNTV